MNMLSNILIKETIDVVVVLRRALSLSSSQTNHAG
jgi:hypothetical protein